MRGRLLSCTLCTALGALTSASADARLLRPSDIARIVNLEQPMISPDGRHIALVAGMTDADRVTSTSELLLVDVASNAISKITVGRGVSDPRWSPDGKRLGYLASDRRDGRFQVFVRDNELHVVDGGRDVDVTRRLDRNVGGSLWLPGSKSLRVRG